VISQAGISQALISQALISQALISQAVISKGVILHTGPGRCEMTEFNVLGEPLQLCGTDPMTGFYRDGDCACGPDDLGRHAVCALMTVEFLAHQRSIGNDLSTPRPELDFPGLRPGDRWCVVALRWLQAHADGVAAPVVLASTNQQALQVIPLELLRRHAVDVPDSPAGLF
jgi:uncharacterized protein (DUF2237 family)